MARLFALDRNFPQPIVDVLAEFQADAKLVSLDAIDRRLSTLDDWELLLALHHHPEPWDGLITTDSSMLAQGRELAALIQTKLTLVVAMESGHNPVKASGSCSPTSRASASGRPPIRPRYGGSMLQTAHMKSHGTCSRALPLITDAKRATSGPK